MTMEDVEKDVISVNSNKRKSFLGLNKSFVRGYRRKKYKLLLPLFRKNNTPSRKIINDFIKNSLMIMNKKNFFFLIIIIIILIHINNEF